MSLTTGTKEDVKSSRVSSTRATETRDHETRQAKSLQPISGLDAPTPPPGIVFKWVRYFIGANEDIKNVIDHELAGWVNVPPDDITDPKFANMKAAAKKRGMDRLQYGVNVLMQNDIANTEQARRESQRALDSLNASLADPKDMQNIGERRYVQTRADNHTYYE